MEERRLPQSQTGRLAVAETIGQDGWRLLTDLFDEAAPAFLREIPAVNILRQIWVQNYRYDDGQLHWREPSDIPPATRFINSPYDQEARYGKKYSTRWTGYKVHLTETCEADQPHLIIHVATTPAPQSDVSMTEVIQADLQLASFKRPKSSPNTMRCDRVSKRRFRRRVRAFGMRRSRYIGLAKTHLQHVGIAAAINLVRVVAWLDGDELAPTRLSAFQRLYAAA